ncbi:MAG: hypothetical protein HC827_01085 [Cyanobacteria bacterium RM1_2_2]|nr:hypothetical protein [Cyanobacteria bacterium RM1_2_2]
MTIEHAQLESRHFDFLKLKYHVDRQQRIASPDFLYFILRRANSGSLLTGSEQNWLKQQGLFATLQIIQLEAQLQPYQVQEQMRMKAEFEQLQAKYQPFLARLLTFNLHSILWKLDHQRLLDNVETQFLQDSLFEDLLNLARKIQGFSVLKQKYGAANHPDFLPDGQLFFILQRLRAKEELDEAEAQWLLDQNLLTTFAVHEQQKQERQLEAAFVQLKVKYQVSDHPDRTVESKLYFVLQKLETEALLDAAEVTWLKTQPQLENLLHLHQKLAEQQRFAELKLKYKATHSREQSPQSKLCKVLIAIDADQPIDPATIDWLEKQGLPESARIVRHHYFQQLCRKYRIIRPPFDPFYEIMLKLEREERLERLQVAQLINEEQLQRDGKIAKAHHCLEAAFYEQEHRRTGNGWNIVNAMSDWRKAGELDQALNLTQNLNWKKISDRRLKAALLTNRGFTLKDRSDFLEAFQCAEQAITFNSQAFQPCLLLSILSYKTADYTNGDIWMQKAIERGANPGDLDYEMKRLVKNAKNAEERKRLVDYLLKTDPQRYSWAKEYQK